jgi:hypothetical protein
MIAKKLDSAGMTSALMALIDGMYAHQAILKAEIKAGLSC